MQEVPSTNLIIQHVQEVLIQTFFLLNWLLKHLQLKRIQQHAHFTYVIYYYPPSQLSEHTLFICHKNPIFDLSHTHTVIVVNRKMIDLALPLINQNMKNVLIFWFFTSPWWTCSWRKYLLCKNFCMSGSRFVQPWSIVPSSTFASDINPQTISSALVWN